MTHAREGVSLSQLTRQLAWFSDGAVRYEHALAKVRPMECDESVSYR